MFKTKKLAYLCSALILFAACSKDGDTTKSKNALNEQISQQSQGEYPFEIYSPTTNDAYAEMKSGLLEAFNSSSESKAINVNKAVFLLEAGLSALFESDEYLDFDSTITEHVAIDLSFNENATTMGEVKSSFTEVYDAITLTLATNGSYTVDAVDIRYTTIDGTGIHFSANIVYVLNGSGISSISTNSPYYWGTVSSAPYSAFAGINSRCSFDPTTRGAWRNVTAQVKAVAPMINQSPSYHTAYFNNVYFTTDAASIAPNHLDGSYLLGFTNAPYPHHQGPTPQATCVTKSEQNWYAQAIVDQLWPIVGKRNYWNGLNSFRVKMDPGNSVFWVYDAHLAAVAVTDLNNQLQRSDLGFF